METNETRKGKYNKKNLKEKNSKYIYICEKETLYFYYTK
jgi:hypothetical protein